MSSTVVTFLNTIRTSISEFLTLSHWISVRLLQLFLPPCTTSDYRTPTYEPQKSLSLHLLRLSPSLPVPGQKSGSPPSPYNLSFIFPNKKTDSSDNPLSQESIFDPKSFVFSIFLGNSSRSLFPVKPLPIGILSLCLLIPHLPSILLFPLILDHQDWWTLLTTFISIFILLQSGMSKITPINILTGTILRLLQLPSFPIPTRSLWVLDPEGEVKTITITSPTVSLPSCLSEWRSLVYLKVTGKIWERLPPTPYSFTQPDRPRVPRLIYWLIYYMVAVKCIFLWL